MSNWTRVAFVSKRWPTPSPVLALNYFGDELEGLLCDAIPEMLESNPASSLAAFAAKCVQTVGDPRCVELWNLDVACEDQCRQQSWPGDHRIWEHVDALVDVDDWVIYDPAGQHPIAGAETQPRFDAERFECWPRRFAWLASFFVHRKPKKANP